MVFLKYLYQVRRLFILLFSSLILIVSPLNAKAASLTVEWDANKEEDLLGYTVHWGTVPKKYTDNRWVGELTKYEITGLQDGTRYYFSITAVDVWGNESVFSKEVSAVAGDSPVVPSVIELGDNYPNPFNPGTYIDFIVPDRVFITISVFNSLGQKIRTLENNIFQAGKYYTYWDGNDDNGQKVASGIYFYQLEARNQLLKKSMILVH